MLGAIKKQVKPKKKYKPVTTAQRVLLLSPFFFPEQISTGRYNTWLVRRLVQSGARVDVVTSYPLYPAWRPMPTDDSDAVVDIHRSGLHVRYPKSAIGRRLVLEIWFGLYALFWTVKLRKKVDTVVAVIPPEFFLPVIRAILPKGVRLVGIVHDLQGIMAESTRSWGRRAVAKAVGAIERRALATCDKLICLNESMQRAIVVDYGIERDKCEVHYPFPTLTGSSNRRGNLGSYFPQGFHHIVYAGALGEKQRPWELVEFLERLGRRRSDIMGHLFSEGPQFEAIRREVEKRGIERLVLRGLVPDEDLAELYDRSTVQIVPQAQGTGSGAFPSKLPNLFSAGVPVFAICEGDSDLARVLRESRLGTSVDGTDVDVWVERMEEFLVRIAPMPRDVLRRTANEYLAKNFNLDRLIAAIL